MYSRKCIGLSKQALAQSVQVVSGAIAGEASSGEVRMNMLARRIVLGRRPFVVLREKHEIGICYQIGTVDTFKAPSISVTNLGLI